MYIHRLVTYTRPSITVKSALNPSLFDMLKVENLESRSFGSSQFTIRLLMTQGHLQKKVV